MNPKLLVQSLKGSKAQILWAFFMAAKAMDEKEVREWVDLKPETVHNGCRALVAAGLLGVQVNAHGRKVWLLGSEMLPVLRDLVGHLGAGRVLEADEQPVLQESKKRITVSISRSAEELQALNIAMRSCEIVGKKKQELLDCEWVTADYVRAHVDYARAEGRGEYAAGMAITRMLDHAGQPPRRPNGHIVNCACEKCSEPSTRADGSSKYVSGAYSDYIEH